MGGVGGGGRIQKRICDLRSFGSWYITDQSVSAVTNMSLKVQKTILENGHDALSILLKCSHDVTETFPLARKI